MPHENPQLQYDAERPGRGVLWWTLIAGLGIIPGPIYLLHELAMASARTQGSYTADQFVGRTGAALLWPAIVVLGMVWFALLVTLVVRERRRRAA